MNKIRKILFVFIMTIMVGSYLPVSNSMFISSAHAADSSSVTSSLTDSAKAIGSKIASLDKYFINFIKNIRGPLVYAVGVFSFIVGIFMEMFAISRLTKPGMATQKGTMGGTFGMIIIGAMMISLPSTINVLEKTIFNQTQIELAQSEGQSWTVSELAYMKNVDSEDEERNERIVRALNAAFQYIRIFGLISFIRGLYLMKAVLDGGQATMLNANLHLFGGVLAMNIAPVLRIFFATVNDSG